MAAPSQSYDVIIIGGGVTGTAELFLLTHFTNVRRILFIERRTAVGTVNSNRANNSQTLHKGPIETNYLLQAALKVRQGANLVEGYIDRMAPDVGMRIHKMVIGVGDKEVATIRARCAEFAPHFSDIRLLERDELAVVEPCVMNGRDPKVPIVALMEERGYAVDYQRLAESFLAAARRTGAHIDFVFHEQVDRITKVEGGHEVTFGKEKAFGAFTIVAAGSPSLVFAHALGYGREYGMLPVAGSFYLTRGLNVNGKVYTVQNPKIPFAAPHVDPAVYDRLEARFGPTAKPMPLLERGNWSTFKEFMRTGTATPSGLLTALTIATDPDIAGFLLRNQAYDLPFIGKHVFLRDARKICPALEAKDLTLDKGAGGIRGQLIDKKKRCIARGKDKFVGDRIVFIMAPSPGASYCLGNAEEDVQTMQEQLGSTFRFDRAGMRHALGVGAAPAATAAAAS